MSLALKRERRLALVAGPGCSLLAGGCVIELGAGAGRSVLALSVTYEDHGGDDEDDENGDADDDGDDGGGDGRTFFGLENG